MEETDFPALFAAKTDPDDASVWLPLDVHQEDTAEVIVRLVRRLPEATLRAIGMERETCRRLLAFLALVHDIGKSTRLFQTEITGCLPEARERLERAGFSVSSPGELNPGRSHHERFWLFHDQRPFGQLPKVQGTYFDAKKINAAISESGNTVRLFSERCGTKKNTLSYAEAARWMIHLNVFDDGACKSSPEKDPNRQLPPLKVGYLCDMGVIVAQGKNLFQTLMLNMVLLKNGTEEWPEENCPAWEKDTVNTAERFEVAMPQNQAELLTLPFRRIALERENCGVTG